MMQLTKNILICTSVIIILYGCSSNRPVNYNNKKNVSIQESGRAMNNISNEKVDANCKSTVLKAINLSNNVKNLMRRLNMCNSSQSALSCISIRSELCSTKSTLDIMSNKVLSDCKGSALEKEANILGANFKETSSVLGGC